MRKFDIGDNPIGSECAVAFASMLKKSQCLKILDLCGGSVGVKQTWELIKSLKQNITCTLEKLTLQSKQKKTLQTLN